MNYDWDKLFIQDCESKYNCPWIEREPADEDEEVLIDDEED